MAGNPSKDEACRQFTTGVAFITTNGKRGPNVMSAEWTFNVSYEPFLISVHIDPEEATHEAILETGEFGVNIAAEEQVVAMGFAGHFSKKEVDKLSSELFETYPAVRIKVPMIRGCLLNAECRLVQRVTMGDHTAFIGEVVEFTADPARRPVVLHRGARGLGPRIERRDSLALAATPSGVRPSTTITVTGEFTGPSRGEKPLQIALLGPDGKQVASIRAATDAHGYFSSTIPLPADLPRGRYRVVALHDGVMGAARLELM